MKQQCGVCMRHCELEEGQTGFCRARWNVNGKIESKNYGKITSIALDMIEKKPLRLFYPGSMILSVGSFGCNMRCPFCQNYEISMAGDGDVGYTYMSPQELAEKAEELKSENNIGMAYTYNEPTIGYEFVRDTSILIHEKGMKNVLVTNGSACLPILEEILPWIDAMNIDLKCFSEEGYKSLGGDFETVKAFIRRAAKDCHVELTCLIVPGLNDKEEEMEEMCKWIASMNKDIPLHISRFFPMYHKLDAEPTSVALIYDMIHIAEKHLTHVFSGNI